MPEIPRTYDPKPEEVPGLPVAGYRPTQSPEAIALVNEFKFSEERLLRQLDALKTGGVADQRWLQIGRTALEEAFMFINRAVFKPGRVEVLPEELPNENGSADIFETAAAAREVR